MRSLLLLLLTPALFAQQRTDGAPAVIEGPQTAGTAPARASEPALMTNDTIRKMHAAGLNDELILQTIQAQPGRYSLAADDLIALKQAGVSDALLAAMANKARTSLTHHGSDVVELSPVNEIGVYYRSAAGGWVPMESEVVHIKSGGFIKSHLTNGIIKEDRNGVVSGREAKLLLPRPIEFLIYTPDGVEGAEYDLLRFRLNSKDREFRTLTGGIIHSTSGAKRDEVPFKPRASRRTPTPSPCRATCPAASTVCCRPEPATSPTEAKSTPSPQASSARSALEYTG